MSKQCHRANIPAWPASDFDVRTWRSLVGICLLAAPLCAAQAGKQPDQQNAKQNAPAVEMANVLFRYSPSLTVNVVALRGALLPTAGHDAPSFNDPSSFAVGTDAAEFRMSAAQMTALMNTWLLRSPKAQLKDVRIAFEGDALRIR